MVAQEIIAKLDTQKAGELLARVDNLLDTARESQAILERAYLDIGVALKDVQDTRAWMLREFHSFDSYVREWCEPRFNRKRNQLYAYKTAAEQLLPHYDRPQLISMGVTKAVALAGYVKKSGGKKPPTPLSDNARNPQVGIDEFRADVAAASHIPLDDKGKWYEPFGGFYVSPEERAEFERVITLAREQANIPNDCPEWFQKKLIAQTVAMECLSSWGGQRTVTVQEEF